MSSAASRGTTTSRFLRRRVWDGLSNFPRRRPAKVHATLVAFACLVIAFQVASPPEWVLTFVCRGTLARSTPALSPCSTGQGTASSRGFRIIRQATTALADLASGEEYPGTVSELFGDGVMVDIQAEVPGFVPKSALAEPLKAMKVGQKVNARVVRVQEEPRNRRSNGVFRQRLQLTLRKDKTPLTDFNIGDGAAGVVEYVAKWGAFVDIGSDIAGMLPKAQMQDKSLHGKLKVGAKVNVWVRGLGLQDGRAQLTTRNLEAGFPADVLDMSEFPEGTACPGTVMRVRNFGAFIDVGTQNWALCHIREINEGFIDSVASVLRVGDLVNVEVSRNTGEELNVRLDDPEYAQDLDPFRALGPNQTVTGEVVRQAGDKWLVLAVTTAAAQAYGMLERENTRLDAPTDVGSKLDVYILPDSQGDRKLYLSMYSPAEWKQFST